MQPVAIRVRGRLGRRPVSHNQYGLPDAQIVQRRRASCSSKILIPPYYSHAASIPWAATVPKTNSTQQQYQKQYRWSLHVWLELGTSQNTTYPVIASYSLLCWKCWLNTNESTSPVATANAHNQCQSVRYVMLIAVYSLFYYPFPVTTNSGHCFGECHAWVYFK